MQIPVLLGPGVAEQQGALPLDDGAALPGVGGTLLVVAGFGTFGDLLEPHHALGEPCQLLLLPGGGHRPSRSRRPEVQ